MCKTVVPHIQLRVAVIHQVVPRLPETKEQEEKEEEGEEESDKQDVFTSYVTTTPVNTSS